MQCENSLKKYQVVDKVKKWQEEEKKNLILDI